MCSLQMQKEILGDRPFPIEKEYEQYLLTSFETPLSTTENDALSESTTPAPFQTPSENDVFPQDSDGNGPSCGPNRNTEEKLPPPLEVVTASETLLRQPGTEYKSQRKEAMLFTIKPPVCF